MHLDFLCHHHRLSLQNNLDDAYRVWEECQDRLEGSRGDPTPYQVSCAGSALEAAGIYLLGQDTCDSSLIERYGSSALTLINMLIQLRNTQMAILVIATATALVEQVARECGDRATAFKVIRALTIVGRRMTTTLPANLSGCASPTVSMLSSGRSLSSVARVARRESEAVH